MFASRLPLLQTTALHDFYPFTGTYRTSSTSDYFLYNGEFKHAPDQLVRNDGEFLYFTESGGGTPGVYVRFFCFVFAWVFLI